MKLFIFRPSEHWDYCGGAVIFAAEKFEDIQAMVDAEVKKAGSYGRFAQGGHTFLEGEPGPLSEEQLRTGANYAWVLDKVFEILGDIQPGLVFENANYA